MNKIKPLALMISAIGLGSALMVAPAAADDVSDLKAQMKTILERNAELAKQIEELQKNVKKLDSDVGNVPKTFKVVTAGDEDGTFKLPGSETSVGIYGFIHLDAFHDLKGRSSGDWASDIGSTPLNNGVDDTRNGKTTFTARTSRFGLKTATPTEMGILRTKLEADFNKSTHRTTDAGDHAEQIATNSFGFRLRHAYGEITGDWGTLLAGQTWSTFMNLDAAPETVDFNTNGSAVFVRQPMIRYTLPAGAAGSLALAIENPASQAEGGGFAPQITPNINKRPDLIANWTLTKDWGFVSAQGLLTEFRFDNAAGVTDNKNGYGLGLGGAFKVTDKDTILAQYTTGKGIGRYMPTTAFHIAVFDPATNQIRLYRSNSAVLGWTRNWTDTVRTNLSYGGTRIQNNFNDIHAALGDGILDSRRMEQGFANVIWGFTKNTELGLEYAWGKRETHPDVTGATFQGRNSRLQTSLHYSF